MSRKRLEPGEPGEFIGTPQSWWNDEREIFEISCLIGEPIGKPSRHWGSGATIPKAKAALRRAIKDWEPRAAALGAYGKNCTVDEVVVAWIESYEGDKTKRPQNAGKYRREIERSESPRAKKDKIVIVGSDLGRMKVKDVMPYHIRIHLAQLNWSTNKQSIQKSILNSAFQMVVDDGLLTYNPVLSVKGHRGEQGASRRRRKNAAANPYFPDEPMPFTPEEYAQYRQLESDYFANRDNTRWQRRPDPRFLDLTRLAYESAARPGEVVALRWDDVDVNARTVTICGTVVTADLRVRQIRKLVEDYDLAGNEIGPNPKWQGKDDDAIVLVNFRQPFTKTRDSMRTVRVGAETLAMLRRRRLAAKPGQTLVFPGRSGVVLPTRSMAAAWRAIVQGTTLEWSTPRTLRSTRATRVAEVHGLPAARLILGHEANSMVTTQHYVTLGAAVVDYVDVQ